MNTSISEENVYAVLRQVIDPELGCNIVDLGLIYSVEITDRTVRITMTLTTPGCPMHESIAGGVYAAVMNLEEIEEAEVNVVWDPPWNPGMMNAEARQWLGVRA